MSELLDLPLSGAPSPLTRGKLKQLAFHCDLNADAIIAHAQAQASSSGIARLAQADANPTGSFAGRSLLNVQV